MSKVTTGKDTSHTRHLKEKKPYQITDSNRRNKLNLATTNSTSNNEPNNDSTTSIIKSSKPISMNLNKQKLLDLLDLSKINLSLNKNKDKISNLSEFKNLHKLNLMECNLLEINFVKELKLNLTWLNVSGNNLSNENAWNGVEELTRLFVLNASNCSLKEVPSIVESLHSLKALVISHNSLTSLTHIKSLANLNTIVVSNNQLTSLPDTLTTLPALKKISAAHNLLTPSTLPNLSPNSLLKEIKFNDNPHLTSLPTHFSTWGKGSLNGIEFKGKRKSGLEIIDLGNCGFKNWSDLRELAGQETVLNLGLKGNLIAEEAKEEGFEEFRRKITILLPSLRILDNNRFDPKHFDLKAKRALRPADQKIVDSGPMGLAINAKSITPIEVSKEVERRRKRKLDLIELGEEEERLLEEIKRKKLEEKEVRRKIFEEKEKKVGLVKGVVKELRKKKFEKRNADNDTVMDVEVEQQDKEEVEEVEVPIVKKEKKNKKAKLAAALALAASTSTSDSIDPSSIPLTSTSTDPTTAVIAEPTTTIPTEPLIRKRGRKSNHISTLTTPLIVPERKPSASKSILDPSIRNKKNKSKKSAGEGGGILSVLKGTESEQLAEKEEQLQQQQKNKRQSEYIPTGSNSILPTNPKEDEIIQKEKTSVLKVVEVKRSKKDLRTSLGGGSGVGGGVEDLMLGKKDTVEVGLGGWD